MAKIASDAQWKDLAKRINGKQEKLIAGANVNISGAIISATDTTYEAGTGLQLADKTFNIDTETVAQKTDLKGYATTESLSGYATTEAMTAAITTATADMATKTELATQLTAVYKYKGSLTNKDELDAKTDGNTTGDVYNVEDTGDNYAWNGKEWDKLAGTIDLSGYAKTTDLSKYATVESLDAYAKTADMTSAIEAATTDLATEAYVDGKVSEAAGAVTEYTNEEWQGLGFEASEAA